MDQGQPSSAQQEPFGVDEPQGPRPPAMTDNDRLLAGLSYLSQLVVPAVMPVVLMLTDETKAKSISSRSDFVRFHAVHGLALFVAAVIYELAAVIVFAILGAIAPFLTCVAWLLFLAPVAVLIYYGVLAFQGRRTEIPWLTQFLRDNNWL